MADRMQPQAARAVAVFPDRPTAERKADELRRIDSSLRVRIDERADEIDSLRGEMREELEHTVFAPGNVGPFTKEMARGLVPGIVLFGLAGALIALPFALIPVGNLALGSRLILCAAVGLFAGATLGFVAGGGGGERDTDAKQLAAEQGTVVAVEGSDPQAVEEAARTLAGGGALRVDTLDQAGIPIAAHSPSSARPGPSEGPSDRR